MDERGERGEVIVVRRSDVALFTSREGRGWENETVELVHRAGLVRQFGSGLYGFTPTGERVRQNVIRRIVNEMTAIGGQRIALPQLQYAPIWERSGRWANFEGEMFTLENRDGRSMCLAPSHEEGVVHLVDGTVRSYDDLPLLVFQIGTKQRDDHPRNGLCRTKEFTMKDAYSLHATRASLEEWYERVRAAYCRLFDSLDLDFAIVDADNSVMGGSTSEEFVARVDQGQGSVDLISCVTSDCRFGLTDESAGFDRFDDGGDCPDCGGRLESGEGIEIGHAFDLGTRYAEAMDLTVDTADATTQNVLMGSYGIGVERLVHTIVEQHADDAGCRWPETGSGHVAPYTASIVPIEYDGELAAVADRLHRECGRDEVLLFDDPEQSIGERFAESDLLGVPWKAILGNHFRETGEVELETRDGDTQYVKPEAVSDVIGRG